MEQGDNMEQIDVKSLQDYKDMIVFCIHQGINHLDFTVYPALCDLICPYSDCCKYFPVAPVNTAGNGSISSLDTLLKQYLINKINGVTRGKL